MDPKDPARNNGPLTVLDHLNQVSRQLVKSGFKTIGDTCKLWNKSRSVKTLLLTPPPKTLTWGS